MRISGERFGFAIRSFAAKLGAWATNIRVRLIGLEISMRQAFRNGPRTSAISCRRPMFP